MTNQREVSEAFDYDGRDATVERISGGWLCSDIVDGQYVKHRYYDYSRREALELFVDYVRESVLAE